MTRRSLPLAALLLAFAVPALGYGDKAHRVVAELARGPMLSAPARAAVTRILGSDDLAAVACWADDIRPDNPLAATAEGIEVNRAFPRSEAWHYISLPLETTTAAQAARFQTGDDVVSAIRRMVEALEQPERPGSALTHRRALMWLVHLVADLHNPMHGATCYYSVTRNGAVTVVTAPGRAETTLRGEGGNEVRIGSWRLHAYWDTPMVDAIRPGAGAPGTVAYLSKQCPTSPVAAIDPKTKPEVQWALDTVTAAMQAYRGITARSALVNGRRVQVTADMAPTYAADHQAMSERRLVLAAQRLAGLLNGIRWAD